MRADEYKARGLVVLQRSTKPPPSKGGRKKIDDSTVVEAMRELIVKGLAKDPRAAAKALQHQAEGGATTTARTKRDRIWDAYRRTYGLDLPD